MVKAAGELKQNDCERDREPGNTTHGGSGGDQGIHAGNNARFRIRVRVTTSKEACVRVREGQILHHVPRNAAEEAANHHGWHVNAGWYLDSKGNHCQDGLE